VSSLILNDGFRIGTAGWAVPKGALNDHAGGSALQRYANVLNCAEINSTFSRSHRSSTYERWAQSVPASFQFSVKMPKAITHERKLEECRDAVEAFVEETDALGSKRAIVLVQLPPKLAYDPQVARRFFGVLSHAYRGRVALEPRHPSWFTQRVDAWLDSIGVARVAADPAVVPYGAVPGGTRDFAYYRLHGSPRTYYSSYDDAAIGALADSLQSATGAWCIFDNTASGAAFSNAIALRTRLASGSARAGEER
jgi:uncharacterized protein YecE (DUF72 family)